MTQPQTDPVRAMVKSMIVCLDRVRARRRKYGERHDFVTKAQKTKYNKEHS